MLLAKKILFGTLVIGATVLGCSTTKKAVITNVPVPDPRWAAIDSLAAIGQFASALDATGTILSQAQLDGDQLTEFRAWMYKGRFQRAIGVERKEVIAAMEQRANTTVGLPLKPLLRSVIGESYWLWYQDDRWRILERTAQDEPGDDPDTWDQRTFMRKVIDAYRASLDPCDTLAAMPVGDLAPLLLPERGAETILCPTVHDILARRALDIFRNSETRLSEPTWRFQLDDPAFFSLFEAFAHKPLAHRDSTAREFQALQLFQRLERQHLIDARPDALVNITLDRLHFVRERSGLPQKDSLYLGALELLRSRLPNDTCEAEVITAIAQWHADQGEKYQRLDPSGAWKTEKRTAADLCRTSIAKWPGSFGATNAKALLARLVMPVLSVEVEEANTPDVPFRAALTHTNVEQVWLRIVKDDRDEHRSRDEDGFKRLLKSPAVRAWSALLTDDGDLNAHRSELPVDGLPLGNYQLIVSDAESFALDGALVLFTPFTITRLALTTREQPDRMTSVLVTDRVSGAPLRSAKAELFSQRWSNGTYRDLPIGSALTDEQGIARVPVPNDLRGQYTWKVSHAGDQQRISSYGWYQVEDPDRDTLRTFLFTDRAIFRPGQEVHYKGIVSVRRAGTTITKASYHTSVRFVDVNGDEVAKHDVTTDAYGAFHGTFTAPRGVLTGEMTISEAHGSRSIRVEEYKRPTFEVLLDPVTTTPKLGEEATVTGKAMSYAGVPLDGAQVRWKVLREARMPWWCSGYWRNAIAWGQPTEVANGTATTDASGAFTIRFTAQADQAITREADPVFQYTVETSVTDINGETQESGTRLSVGYRSIDIDLQVGDAIDRTSTDSLRIEVRNLNGQPVDVPMNITIARLNAPPKPLRDRLWERPDRMTLTREQHSVRFPDDVYAQENDPLTWPKETVVHERSDWRSRGKSLPIGSITGWDVGMYLIDVTAKDKDDRPVSVRKAVVVYDPEVQHTGFVNDAFHVEAVRSRVEPGGKAVLLLSSALPEARVLMEVERNGTIAVRRWFTLNKGQQRVDLEVLEGDRGGFSVHLLCVERGREHRVTVPIDVPWTNKELHVDLMSFRDKVLPGAREEWRLRITGNKNARVAAQLLAAMYDASLDHFVPNSWNMDIWPRHYARQGWNAGAPFGTSSGQLAWWDRGLPAGSVHAPPVLNTFGFDGPLYGSHAFGYLQDAAGGPMQKSRVLATMAPSPGAMEASSDAEDGDHMDEESREPEAHDAPATEVKPGAPSTTRTDFRETAFFFPDLMTDKDGAVVLRFTMPEALTRWKLMGLAHTADLKLATFTKEAISQKPLMVVPNLPRFLREGDRITLTAKINAIEAPVNGTSKLELFDPFTNRSISASFQLKEDTRTFSAAPGQSASVAWDIAVPAGVGLVSVRITASGNGFSDGEERPLPVLTDKLLVTESLPLWNNGKGTRTFTLDKLKNNTSTSLRTQALKLEYTPSPAWYAVQALPYLMEYPHECAEQTFSRYYANTLAAHIVNKRPRIKAVFERWKHAGPDAFASALEKNTELKGVLLEETPWVLNARSERESKERIALLFDLQRMGAEQATALKKLREMQLPNGAWPWWSGMRESRYITQHIVAGFGHLEKLDAVDLRPDGMSQQMVKDAVRWLDGEVERAYRDLVKHTKKEELDRYVPGHSDIHFLYARSFFGRWTIDGATRTAVDFYLKRLKATWLQQGLQDQAMAALAMHRLGEPEVAQLIMRSLSERATRSEELGMFWKGFVSGFDWWSFPTETHALLIEAFNDVSGDTASVNALRTHLLRLKQTTDWKTTKATADACYALLLNGDNWLVDTGSPVITVGGTPISSDQAEAGTGTFEQVFAPATVKPAMAEVTITSNTVHPGWGALHWQYLERMDRITPHESPFSIRKQVFAKKSTDAGTQLVPVGSDAKLTPGDRLTIRIELRTDRPVDHVHLKDLRGAGLEPTETLSGYRYQDGLGYYRTTRDASVNFFFDRIMPGTYVLEYDLNVSHAGDFSNGITTAMCMYAPEFSSHSQGVRVRVEGR